MRNYECVNGRLTPEDVEHIVQSAVASNRLEGLENTPEEIDMLRKYVQGDISRESYKAWILQSVGVTV